VYGAEQHGGRPARERKRLAKTSAEELEADWAPSVVRTTNGTSETFAKPGDFYLNYGAKERVEYGLMMDNGALGDTRHVALLRWLNALPEDAPQPPPFDEAPPRRSDYPQGTEGRASYHADRAEWYRNITGGQELDGGWVASPSRTHCSIGLRAATARTLTAVQTRGRALSEQPKRRRSRRRRVRRPGTRGGWMERALRTTLGRSRSVKVRISYVKPATGDAGTTSQGRQSSGEDGCLASTRPMVTYLWPSWPTHCARRWRRSNSTRVIGNGGRSC
jgi:hypothetical protein